MALRTDKFFVNVAVKDLKQSMDFFGRVGFEFNLDFTDDNAACMILNDHCYAMLLVESMFQTFTKKEIADASRSTEVILSLAAGSIEEVNEIVNRALAAGGKPANDPTDLGFMYVWSFQDLDNHMWEVFYMHPNGAQQQ